VQIDCNMPGGPIQEGLAVMRRGLFLADVGSPGMKLTKFCKFLLLRSFPSEAVRLCFPLCRMCILAFALSDTRRDFLAWEREEARAWAREASRHSRLGSDWRAG
jgi:hypothetical protein